MMTDILTVALKELREIFTFGDARGRGKLSLVVLVLIFGIVFPLQSGREWVETPVNIMVWGWMPFLWVSGVVADLFAGERERHTLEALLATRLSDQAILFGKLLAAMTYGFTLTWLIMLVSLVTVNIGFGGDGLLFYSRVSPWVRWRSVFSSQGFRRALASWFLCGQAVSGRHSKL